MKDFSPEVKILQDLHKFRDTHSEEWVCSALTNYLHSKNLLKEEASVIDIPDRVGSEARTKQQTKIIYMINGNVVEQEECISGRSGSEFLRVKIPESLRKDQDKIRQEYQQIEI